MLDVPIEVQEVIKSDSVLKNFRVHFLNVALDDLTNSDIVFESVSFEESVCNEDTFKFGIYEASRISFETVNVPNIVGATFEASFEYKMPANLVATYGEWYKIPLGTFCVNSCPRDHQNMVHRKVEAYSILYSDFGIKDFETLKMNMERRYVTTYNPNMDYVLASLCPSFLDKMTCEQVFPKYLFEDEASVQDSYYIYKCLSRPSDVIGDSYSDGVYVYYDKAEEVDYEHPPFSVQEYRLYFSRASLYQIKDGNRMDPDAVYKIIVPKGDDYGTYLSLVKEKTQEYGYVQYADYLDLFIQVSSYNRLSGKPYKTRQFMTEKDTYFEVIFYPWMTDPLSGTDSYKTDSVYLVIRSGKFNLRHRYSTETEDVETDIARNLEVFKTPLVYRYKYSDGDGFLKKFGIATSVFDYTDVITTETGDPPRTASNLVPTYVFNGCFDPIELLKNYAELTASIIRPGRDGRIELVHLNNASPIELDNSNIEDRAWWDEYNVAPVEVVLFNYYDPSIKDQIDTSYRFTYYTDKHSVYDLTNNSILQNARFTIETVDDNLEMTDHDKYYVYTGDWYLYYWDKDKQMFLAYVGETYKNVTTIIKMLIDRYFVPYVNEKAQWDPSTPPIERTTMEFTPLEATFKGMPFIQPGDAFRFTANDGTVINSYVLHHEFSGIHHLKEEVTTVQGTITDSEVVYNS